MDEEEVPFIDLAVTSKVLRPAQCNPNQRQIAIRGASEGIQTQIGTARKYNRIPLTVGDRGQLAVGDTGAIWYSHQGTSSQVARFQALYEELVRDPDQRVRFGCH